MAQESPTLEQALLRAEEARAEEAAKRRRAEQALEQEVEARRQVEERGREMLAEIELLKAQIRRLQGAGD